MEIVERRTWKGFPTNKFDKRTFLNAPQTIACLLKSTGERFSSVFRGNHDSKRNGDNMPGELFISKGGQNIKFKITNQK